MPGEIIHDNDGRQHKTYFHSERILFHDFLVIDSVSDICKEKHNQT